MDNSSIALAPRKLEKYCVVHFLKEKTIDVVPKKWLFPRPPEPNMCSCMLPPDNKGVKKLVKEDVEPRDSWIMNRCQLLHTSKTYTQACAALKQYQSERELDVLSTDTEGSQISSVERELDVLSTDTEGSQISSVSIAESPQTSTQVFDVSCSNCWDLKNRMASLEQEVQSLKKILFEVKLNTQATLQSVKALVDLNTPLHLEGFTQLTTVEELKAFNEMLSDKEIFSKMIILFSAYGGKDAHAATRKIMTTMMSNSLAQKYNWIGSAKKNSFREFKFVIQLVAASVRHVKLHADTPVTAIQSWIARWLRYAFDRDTAGKKRKHYSLMCSNDD